MGTYIKPKLFKNEIEDLLLILKNNNYSKGSIYVYGCELRKLANYFYDNGCFSFSKELAVNYYQKEIAKHSGSRYERLLKTIIKKFEIYLKTGQFPFFSKRKQEESFPADFQNAIDSFFDSCRKKGNCERTIRNKHDFIHKFFLLSDCKRITDLNENVISKACEKVLAINSDALIIWKNLFKFFCETGFLTIDYSLYIPKVSHSKKLPTTYSMEEIKKLESSFNQKTTQGIRDYAIVLLASRLGIRVGDIVRLQFENIDFKSHHLNFIQSKTKKAISLYMTADIEQALKNYIENARPKSDYNTIFLRELAPIVPISTAAVSYQIKSHLKQSGINTVNKKRGPHALRSSLATSMINSNISYEAVRKVLGHTNPDVINSYAKLDIEKLRICALKPPVPTGNLAAFLEGYND